MNEIFQNLYEMTAFSNIIAEPQFLIMYAIAFILLYLGIKKQYEPLLLVPIAFGVLLANFPGGDMGVIQADENGMINAHGVMKNIWEMPLHDIAHELGLMNFIYYMLIKTGFLPPIIFMGVGALTDFGPMLRNLRLSIFGAAAQLGIFTVLLVAILMGFRDYRRSGRTDRHLHDHQTGPPSVRTDSDCRLFLYGAGSGYHPSGSQATLFKERAIHQYEGTGKEIPVHYGDQKFACLEDHLPNRSDNGSGPVRAECGAIDRYADVR